MYMYFVKEVIGQISMSQYKVNVNWTKFAIWITAFGYSVFTYKILN